MTGGGAGPASAVEGGVCGGRTRTLDALGDGAGTRRGRGGPRFAGGARQALSVAPGAPAAKAAA